MPLQDVQGQVVQFIEGRYSLHSPAWQTLSLSQTLPHVPQWTGFDSRFTHAPLQSLRPPVQPVVHTPLSHRLVEPEHVAPSQLSGFDCVSMHAGPTRVSPSRQTQLELTHHSSSSHSFGQVPQWIGFAAMFVQLLPQSATPSPAQSAPPVPELTLLADVVIPPEEPPTFDAPPDPPASAPPVAGPLAVDDASPN